MAMNCWHCGRELHLPDGKVFFRTLCDACGRWQHACANCKYYKRGQPNDCLVPGTDPISDRETANFCDEFFSVGVQKLKRGANTSDVEQRLFGGGESPEESDANRPPSQFDDLFKD